MPALFPEVEVSVAADMSPHIVVLDDSHDRFLHQLLASIAPTEAVVHAVHDVAGAARTMNRYPILAAIIVLTDITHTFSVLAQLLQKNHRLVMVGVTCVDLSTADTVGLVQAGMATIITQPHQSADVLQRVLPLIQHTRGSSLSVPLAERERQVLHLLGEGLGPNGISKRLFISIKTVDSTIARLRKKLGVDGTAAVRRYAIEYVSVTARRQARTHELLRPSDDGDELKPTPVNVREEFKPFSPSLLQPHEVWPTAEEKTLEPQVLSSVDDDIRAMLVNTEQMSANDEHASSVQLVLQLALQHDTLRELSDYIRQVRAPLADEHADQVAVIEHTISYLRRHFQLEESLAVLLGEVDVRSHQQCHAAVLHELQYLHQHFISGMPATVAMAAVIKAHLAGEHAALDDVLYQHARQRVVATMATPG